MPALEREQANGSAERILRAATSLFAEHGFHGVSTRSIASAVGLNVATVSYHVGNKQQLYREVLRRLYQIESAVVSRSLSSQEGLADRDLLRGLVDALVGMARDHPELPRLWVRRWLEEPAARGEAEVEFAPSLPRLLGEVLERARQAGSIRGPQPDLGLFLTGFTWMLYGYFVGRPASPEETRSDPFGPERLAAFRAFLHDYLCRMLAL